MAARKKKPAACNDDRDGGGRFQKGHSVKSPGNPNLVRLASLQRAVRDAVTPERLTDVLNKLYDLSMAGDVQAARLLLERALGKPKDSPVAVDLPTVSGVRDMPGVALAVLNAIASGEMTAAEGASITGAAREWREQVAMVEMMERLERLEAKDG